VLNLKQFDYFHILNFSGHCFQTLFMVQTGFYLFILLLLLLYIASFMNSSWQLITVEHVLQLSLMKSCHVTVVNYWRASAKINMQVDLR